MQPKATDADRLLLLTLTLETAVASENWPDVSQLLTARSAILDSNPSIPSAIASEIDQADERMLTCLRKRLVGIRGDMRNLTAALRIAGPYSREQGDTSLSLAS